MLLIMNVSARPNPSFNAPDGDGETKAFGSLYFVRSIVNMEDGNVGGSGMEWRNVIRETKLKWIIVVGYIVRRFSKALGGLYVGLQYTRREMD